LRDCGAGRGAAVVWSGRPYGSRTLWTDAASINCPGSRFRRSSRLQYGRSLCLSLCPGLRDQPCFGGAISGSGRLDVFIVLDRMGGSFRQIVGRSDRHTLMDRPLHSKSTLTCAPSDQGAHHRVYDPCPSCTTVQFPLRSCECRPPAAREPLPVGRGCLVRRGTCSAHAHTDVGSARVAVSFPQPVPSHLGDSKQEGR
jgi:hypothetical protein